MDLNIIFWIRMDLMNPPGCDATGGSAVPHWQAGDGNREELCFKGRLVGWLDTNDLLHARA